MWARDGANCVHFCSLRSSFDIWYKFLKFLKENWRFWIFLIRWTNSICENWELELHYCETHSNSLFFGVRFSTPNGDLATIVQTPSENTQNLQPRHLRLSDDHHTPSSCWWSSCLLWSASCHRAHTPVSLQTAISVNVTTHSSDSLAWRSSTPQAPLYP